jgi:2,5-diketo-D-gluconate reductase A
MPENGNPVPSIALRDGTTIPQLGFGTLAVQADREVTQANIQRSAEVVGQALGAGYRHIDTAQAYGSEPGVGRAIADSGLAREELYVTTKLANAHHRPDDLRRSFDASMDHLGLEQLDLFLVHWPLPTLYDGDYVSTWRAITELVADGRVRSAGVSNFQPAHLERIIAETGITPAVNQFELHPYFTNDAVREACRRLGVAIEAHSPLGHNREPLDDPTISAIAAAHGRSTAQIILRWHVQHGHIAIPKSANPQRMADNIAVFDFALSAGDMAAIDGLDRGPSGRVGPNPDTYDGV